MCADRREVAETLKVLSDAFTKVNRTGSATCRLCGCVIRGRNFTETMTKLGLHGERKHGLKEGP